MDAILPLVGVAMGAGLTFWFARLNARAAERREDTKAEKADALRLATKGREHATRALDIVRRASNEGNSRELDKVNWELDLSGIRLEDAEAEVALIPDPILRPRLAEVLSLVRYPWVFANGSYSDGPPYLTQRQGLRLLREALAAYIREEPTPTEPDELAKLAKQSEDADAERAEWQEEEATAKKAFIAERKARIDHLRSSSPDATPPDAEPSDSSPSPEP